MIKIEHVVTPSPEQWEAVIRGMRNPKNSWDRMDSYETETGEFVIGEDDGTLMERLVSAGTDHRKFMRMIPVHMDITAPLYWWKECDTYKVGTVANSCSTMHKLTAKPIEMSDFSFDLETDETFDTARCFEPTVRMCEELRYQSVLYAAKADECGDAGEAEVFRSKSRVCWDALIKLLPESYNQKRTVMLNYEVLRNMYRARKNHKLREWREFCNWIKTLPYHEYITGCVEW